ncbi:MAG TPA: head-tail adaptor protein [Nocardioides sp.]|nr:head-tail adaptor protein [Nocardioides sp.]
MSLRAMLGQTAEIFRPTKAPDGFGDRRKVWPDEPTQTVPCRLQLLSGTEATEGRDLSIGQWRVYLPPNAVISEHDRVHVDGKKFEVVTVYPVHNRTRLHHYRCDLATYSGEVPASG